MVSTDVSNVNQPASTSTEGGLPSPVTTRQDQTAPSVAQTSTDGMSLVKKRLRQQNISARAWDIIMESWRTGTTIQNRVYLDKWKNFVRTTHANHIHPAVADVINFLTHFYDTGNSYSAINTARSALSAAVDIADSPCTVGKHPLIKRFVKAAF